MSLLAGIIRAIEWLTSRAGMLAAWLVTPLIVAMVWEVFSRYALSTPTLWAFEIGYMLMGAGLMIGMAYAMQTRSHVQVDFFYNALPPRGRAIIDLLGYAILLPMLLWLLYGLWDYLMFAYQNNETSGESAWNPVVWPFRVTFVLGFALFALQTGAEVIKSAYALASGGALDTGAR